MLFQVILVTAEKMKWNHHFGLSADCVIKRPKFIEGCCVFHLLFHHLKQLFLTLFTSNVLDYNYHLSCLKNER